jgi:hypothetical protein
VVKCREAPDQLIQASQLSTMQGDLLDHGQPSPTQTVQQGAAPLGRCFEVRDSRLDLCQREAHVARGGDELQLRQRVLVVVAIAVGQSTRRCDQATAFIKPQRVARQAAARWLGWRL